MSTENDGYECQASIHRLYAYWGSRTFPTPFWVVRGYVEGKEVATSVMVTKYLTVKKTVPEVLIYLQANVVHLMAEAITKFEQ